MIGEVTLTSGKKASYYVDAKRAILRQPAFGALGDLVAAKAERARRGSGRRDDDGRRPDRLAPRSPAPAATSLLAFFVRKEKKEHGLQRWVEGPLLEPGTKVLIVEDVVTTGGSTVKAIERCREEGLEIVGTVSVLDRLAGGAEAIEAAGGGAYTAAGDDRRRLPGPGGLKAPTAASSAACVRRQAARSPARSYSGGRPRIERMIALSSSREESFEGCSAFSRETTT